MHPFIRNMPPNLTGYRRARVIVQRRGLCQEVSAVFRGSLGRIRIANRFKRTFTPQKLRARQSDLCGLAISNGKSSATFTVHFYNRLERCEIPLPEAVFAPFRRRVTWEDKTTRFSSRSLSISGSPAASAGSEYVPWR
jgi:hypothetical protein